MKFIIELTGYGGEIVMGTVANEAYDFFEENEIDINDWALSDPEELDIEVPEEFQPFIAGDWHECDDLAHEHGAALDGMYVSVIAENDDVIHDAFDEAQLRKHGVTFETFEEISSLDPPVGTAVFIGQSFEKGLFQSYQVETDSFDITKLKVYSSKINDWELITGVEYDGIELDDLCNHSTDGKGLEFSLFVIEDDGEDEDEVV